MLQPSGRARFAAGALRLARRAAEVGRGAIQALPLVLVAAALSLFFAQPAPEPAELDALIAVAGIVATVLSLAGLLPFGYRREGVKWIPVHNSMNTLIYVMVLFSKHELGLEFWRKATAVDEHGQTEMFPELWSTPKATASRPTVFHPADGRRPD